MLVTPIKSNTCPQDQINFVISTTNTNTWTGVGFSEDEIMVRDNA